VTINDALPLKASQSDAIVKLKSSWSFESVSVRFAVGCHVSDS